MVYLSRSECRKRFWHVVTYDISDPDHWIELGDIPTQQPCASPAPTAVPAPPITEDQRPPVVPSDIAPVTGDSVTQLKPCRCAKQEEDAEFQLMIALYSNDVNNARSLGYQAGNDPGYSDPGIGFFNPSGGHKPGNCADWAQVSWASLVTRTWRCWHIQKIRARQHWTPFGFHHFAKLVSCSGRVVYLDPWKTGKPDWWEAKDFPFPDGTGWSHTATLTHEAGDAPRDPVND